MKKLFVLAIALTLILTLNAADKSSEKKAKQAEIQATETVAIQTINLSGKVIDLASGESLTGVEVVIEGLDQKAYTDFDGNFCFKNLTPGEYNIIASFISYNKSYIEKFDAEKGSESINIKLQAAQ